MVSGTTLVGFLSNCDKNLGACQIYYKRRVWNVAVFKIFA